MIFLEHKKWRVFALRRNTKAVVSDGKGHSVRHLFPIEPGVHNKHSVFLLGPLSLHR